MEDKIQKLEGDPKPVIAPVVPSSVAAFIRYLACIILGIAVGAFGTNKIHSVLTPEVVSDPQPTKELLQVKEELKQSNIQLQQLQQQLKDQQFSSPRYSNK